MNEYQQYLNQVGLDAVGIVPSTELMTIAQYEHCVESGVPPQLEYLTRNMACRRDFEMIMPGTKSIVCCAVRLPYMNRTPLSYARFCAIGDYHAVVRERLEKLASYLVEHYNVDHYRICVDTAPILERELAVRAGIGEIGYNRMCIHAEMGSFMALGELLVDVDLTVYGTELDHAVHRKDDVRARLTPGQCGCCASGHRLCVRACPVQALTEDGYDMGRCLAYWTTQHKGEIPEPFATSMGNVIWGCDRCQHACPRNADVLRDPHVHCVNGEIGPYGVTPEEILGLSARKLRQRLMGSSIADAHPYMLQRNLCIVIGNTKNSRYADLVCQTAEHHPCEWVQSAARRAITMI